MFSPFTIPRSVSFGEDETSADNSALSKRKKKKPRERLTLKESKAGDADGSGGEDTDSHDPTLPHDVIKRCVLTERPHSGINYLGCKLSSGQIQLSNCVCEEKNE